VLAPPLYWGGQALAAHGIFTEFLTSVPFQRFFNRAILVAAILLLWPTVRSLKIGSVRELGLEPDPRWRTHLAIGFGIAAVLVAAMAGVFAAFAIYKWRVPLQWGALPKIAVSAITVAFLEEALFRGGMFGLFRRSMRPWPALFWVTAIFAIVHFLKPDEKFHPTHVTWMSGFQALPHSFHQFAEPMTLLAGFTTIFTLGWVLGYATWRTRSLWMAIGLHAGVVFVKMGFSKMTKHKITALPWIGDELQIGLVPVAVLAFSGVCVWLWLRYEHSDSRAARL
jgi:membrane protease YdiL (CAAX protease family)